MKSVLLQCCLVSNHGVDLRVSMLSLILQDFLSYAHAVVCVCSGSQYSRNAAYLLHVVWSLYRCIQCSLSFVDVVILVSRCNQYSVKSVFCPWVISLSWCSKYLFKFNNYHYVCYYIVVVANRCKGYPCYNGGTCVANQKGCTCLCTRQYHGTQCEKKGEFRDLVHWRAMVAY